MTQPQNIFSDIPADLPQEFTETLLEASSVRIERIVSCGQTSADGFWHNQDEHEWVMVLRGAAKLVFEGEDDPIEMGPGDFVHIPAHTKHRVEWTTLDEPTVWLAVHYSKTTFEG